MKPQILGLALLVLTGCKSSPNIEENQYFKQEVPKIVSEYTQVHEIFLEKDYQKAKEDFENTFEDFENAYNITKEWHELAFLQSELVRITQSYDTYSYPDYIEILKRRDILRDALHLKGEPVYKGKSSDESFVHWWMEKARESQKKLDELLKNLENSSLNFSEISESYSNFSN